MNTFFKFILIFYLSFQHGLYIPIIHVILCDSPSMCLHENGHKIDESKNWISHTKEWENVVENYRHNLIYNKPPWKESDLHLFNFPGIGSNRIDCKWFQSCITTGWGGYSELYAEIWKWSGGRIENIPFEFREFYR